MSDRTVWTEPVVRVEFVTTDFGPNVNDGVAWVLGWIEKALRDAPFHVEQVHVEHVSTAVTSDL